MKRFILAAVLGGIAVFAWGAISWMVLPWHNATINNIPGEEAVVSVLQEHMKETAVYYFPAWPMDDTEASMRAYENKHIEGPLGMIFYTTPGLEPMMPTTFISGLILMIASAFVASVLLWMAHERLKPWTARVFFVTILGVFSTLVSHVSSWHWNYFPTDYTIVMSADLIVSWLLGGMVIAAIIKPERPETEKETAP